MDGGVSQPAGSASVDRSLGRRVQSRPPASWRRKSYPARGVLEFCNCTKNQALTVLISGELYKRFYDLDKVIWGSSPTLASDYQ